MKLSEEYLDKLNLKNYLARECDFQTYGLIREIEGKIDLLKDLPHSAFIILLGKSNYVSTHIEYLEEQLTTIKKKTEL